MKTIAYGVIAASAIALASGALAADLPRKSAAPAPYLSPAPAFTWTGFYVGVNGGGDWARFTKGGRGAFGNANGGMFGATAGYNYQITPSFVAGIEGDLDWTNVEAKRTNAFSFNSASKAKLSNLFTVRGRLGYSVDRALIYVTGGYAGGSVKSSVVDVPRAIVGSNDSYRSGYALGGGLEYAFTNNISAKAEYIYAKLGEKTYFPAPDTVKSGVNVSTIKAGLNYRF